MMFQSRAQLPHLLRCNGRRRLVECDAVEQRIDNVHALMHGELMKLIQQGLLVHARKATPHGPVFN
jgi:hypothetical protein